MSASEKLLLFALESCRPDQIDALLAIAKAKDLPLSGMVAQALGTALNGMADADRLHAIEQLRKHGIDLEEIF